MAVNQSSVTTGTSTTATVSVTTSESPVTTKVGDYVLIIHGNDFYTLANMVAPTATGSPTINAISGAVADGGTDEAHIKCYWYVANTAGAQVIQTTETGAGDEEKSITAYVLTGVDVSNPIDGATSNTSTTTITTSQVANAISPATVNAFLVAHINAGGGGSSASYTTPSPLTEQYEIHITGYSGVGATNQLSASGSTGNFTFTAATSTAYSSVTIGIRTAASDSAPTPVFDPNFLITPMGMPNQWLGVADVTSAAVQTVAPVGISSSEAVGFQSVTLNLALQGIGTSETLGSAQVIQNLVAASVASADSVGFPSVAQVTTIAPNAINSAEALGNVNVIQVVAPQGIGTSESFGVPALSLNVATTGIQSQEAFGSPTVANVSTIAPVGIPTQGVVGQPSIALNISLIGVSSQEVLGTPVTTLTLSPIGVSTQEAFGVPAVSNVTTIAPTGVSSQEALGQVAVSFTVLPQGIPSTAQFGTIQTTLTVSPVGIPSGETLGSATVQNVTTIAPIGIPAQERLGIPSISLNISPTAVSTNETFGNSSVTPGAVSIAPVGIGTQEAFGVPSVSQVTTVFPFGVTTQERLGLPIVSLNLAPIGISSNESLGSPSITTGAVTVQAYGIPAQTQFGSFTVAATGPGFVVITYGIQTSSAVGFPNIYRAADVEVSMIGKPINVIMLNDIVNPTTSVKTVVAAIPTDVVNVDVATAQAP